jgi:hypothetical protein
MTYHQKAQLLRDVVIIIIKHLSELISCEYGGEDRRAITALTHIRSICEATIYRLQSYKVVDIIEDVDDDEL